MHVVVDQLLRNKLAFFNSLCASCSERDDVAHLSSSFSLLRLHSEAIRCLRLEAINHIGRILSRVDEFELLDPLHPHAYSDFEAVCDPSHAVSPFKLDSVGLAVGDGEPALLKGLAKLFVC